MKYAKLTKDGNIYKLNSYVEAGRKHLNTFYLEKENDLLVSGNTITTFLPKKYPSIYKIAFICDDDKSKEYNLGLFTIKNKDGDDYLSLGLQKSSQFRIYFIAKDTYLEKTIPRSSAKKSITVFFDRLE